MNTVHKIIIIGSGPAGLTAAIYAGRANLSPIVLLGDKPGGQLMGTSEVENWPGSINISGPELMINILKQAEKHGAQTIHESAMQVDFSQRPFIITTNKKTLYSESVIIASGATPLKLQCPGEEEFWGKGVSTCATCDGAFYNDKKVVVLGGGNAGLENALFLTKYTNQVTLIHIDKQLAGEPTTRKKVLQHPSINIIYDTTVQEIYGNEQGLTSVTLINKNTKQTESFSTNGLFLSIGQKPNTNIFANQISMSSYGHIMTTDYVKTSQPGVFVAGDAHDFRYRQAIVSAGFGCIAAIEAQKYLENLVR
jgi:thioredoxin reductase (NADPH)